MSPLRDKISNHLKEAMKRKDERAVSTLRLVTSAMKNKDIEAEMKGGTAINDNEIMSLLQSMIKQRRESLGIFEKAGRQDLADKEAQEIVLIESFLPKQLGEEEAKQAIAKIISETGASGVKDMGKVMAVLKERYSGQMDFGKASPLVKQLLG